jgi:hypothetical protein
MKNRMNRIQLLQKIVIEKFNYYFNLRNFIQRKVICESAANNNTNL